MNEILFKIMAIECKKDSKTLKNRASANIYT